MVAHRRVALTLLMLVTLLADSSPASAQLAVAAASDLQAVLPAIADRYQQRTGQILRISYGSSGNFVTQIQNGAPFDLFLSADTAYAERLVESGHAIRGSLTPYATGRLVLWARRDRPIDVGQGLAALTDRRVRRVAIANPEHAPYGRAAMAALQHAGVAEAVRGKLVLGENIAQAAQFAQSGNADAGLIALSLALSPAMRASGSYVDIPPSSFPAIRQAAVVVSRSRQAEAAQRFLGYLRQPDAVALLRAAGFGVDP
jgi:molybdate transport system substrate-binding protein